MKQTQDDSISFRFLLIDEIHQIVGLAEPSLEKSIEILKGIINESILC